MTLDPGQCHTHQHSYCVVNYIISMYFLAHHYLESWNLFLLFCFKKLTHDVKRTSKTTEIEGKKEKDSTTNIIVQVTYHSGI